VLFVRRLRTIAATDLALQRDPHKHRWSILRILAAILTISWCWSCVFVRRPRQRVASEHKPIVSCTDFVTYCRYTGVGGSGSGRPKVHLLVTLTVWTAIMPRKKSMFSALRRVSLATSGFAILIAAACRPAAEPTQAADKATYRDYSCSDYARAPVLFVHGSGLTSESFSTMQAEFQAQGYPPELLLAIDLTPRDGDNVRAAEKFIAPAVAGLLSRQAEAMRSHACDSATSGKVDIVAHSMGAFSARWAIRFLVPEQVQTLVTLAGANHGTNSLCGRSGVGDRQMCPAFAADEASSRSQAALNGTPQAPADETPYGQGMDTPIEQRIPPGEGRNVVYFTVRIDPDRWIEPADSALLNGAGGRNVAGFDRSTIRETSTGNYLFLAATSHDGLPYHPELIKFVLALLQ
jgi:pimeloyl-ACP methyl ester carboxylesterase